MKVRALTYFASGVSDWGREGIKAVVERGIEVLERAREIVEGMGIEVWTLRISLPEMPTDASLDRVASVLTDVLDVRRYLASIGGVYVGRATPMEIAEACARGLYVPILGLWMDPGKWSTWVSRVLHEVAGLSPEACTRVGVSLGVEPVETPYFPLSTSSRLEGLGVAYLYVDLARELVRGSMSVELVSRKLLSVAKAIEESGIVKRVGIDYSLSPWMEESVAELIELMGFEPLRAGSSYAVSKLNELVSRLASLGPAMGFNEVMLPYAEDSRLRELGAKGLVRARDFLPLVATCLAGLDMLVLPADKDALRKLVLDAYAIARAKGRAAGLRVIPAASEVGEAVDLGRFGRVAAIAYE